MRPNAALIALAALIGVAVAGALLAPSSDDGDTAQGVAPDAVVSATADVVVGASTGVTATATPRPEALRDFPPAQWTAIDAAETEEAGDGNMFLLDLETGQLYSPTAEVLTWEARVSAFISWAENGQIEVGMLGFSDFLEGKRAVYLGETLGLMQKLPSSGDGGNPSALSSTGLLAYKDSNKVVLFDVATRQRVAELPELPELPGSIRGWSADGRYLSFGVSPNTRSREEPLISVWDIETARVAAEVIGERLVWAASGHRFLYGAIDPSDPELRIFEQRVYDIDSGTEQVIQDVSEEGSWSSQRYVITDASSSDDEGRKYGFTVYDLAQERYVMTLRGAWPGAWLDEDTLSFTGDVCDSFGFYTIDSDGSNLEKVIEFGGMVVVHPSRQGDRIAYSQRGDSGGFVTTVMDLATRQMREYATGDALLPPYENTAGRFWSPDGRYLALIKPAGKGGRCEFDAPQKLEVEVH